MSSSTERPTCHQRRKSWKSSSGTGFPDARHSREVSPNRPNDWAGRAWAIAEVPGDERREANPRKVVSPIARSWLSERPEGSAIVEVRIGAIMTTGRPESYPPAQSLLEAVWCVGHSGYGVPDRSCRFCRTSFPQAEGLWKYAVGHYICGGCRDRALKLPKKP
jgi:hypothetical protein